VRGDHTIEAGELGRMLAKGDLLRTEDVTPGGLIVRRALAGLRAAADAHAAQRRGHTARQHELTGSYQSLRDAYRQRETTFAAVIAARSLCITRAGRPKRKRRTSQFRPSGPATSGRRT
jgi:hypothetical protein